MELNEIYEEIMMLKKKVEFAMSNRSANELFVSKTKAKIINYLISEQVLTFGVIKNKLRGYNEEEIRSTLEEMVNEGIIDKNDSKNTKGLKVTYYSLKKGI